MCIGWRICSPHRGPVRLTPRLPAVFCHTNFRAHSDWKSMCPPTDATETSSPHALCSKSYTKWQLCDNSGKRKWYLCSNDIRTTEIEMFAMPFHCAFMYSMCTSVVRYLQLLPNSYWRLHRTTKKGPEAGSIKDNVRIASMLKTNKYWVWTTRSVDWAMLAPSVKWHSAMTTTGQMSPSTNQTTKSKQRKENDRRWTRCLVVRVLCRWHMESYWWWW